MLVLPLVCHEYSPVYAKPGMYAYDPYEMYHPPPPHPLGYDAHYHDPHYSAELYYPSDYPPASPHRAPRRKTARHGARGSGNGGGTPPSGPTHHPHSLPGGGGGGTANGQHPPSPHLTPDPSQTASFPADSSNPEASQAPQFTVCQHKINQRLKQIQYGKNTIGYHTYIQAVPADQREEGNERHPVTPRVDQQCSKRNWDAQVQKWRRDLHMWDPPASASEEGSERGTHHSTSGSEGEEFCGGEGAARGSPHREPDQKPGDRGGAGDRALTLAAVLATSKQSGSGGGPAGSATSTSAASSHSGSTNGDQHHSWASEGSEEPNWEDVQDFLA